MKLANLINLKPLKEGSMQAQELADRNSLQQLQSMYDQLMRDMEQEAEPEGGPIADQYADQMEDIENAMQIKRGDSGGGMTYDDMLKKHYGKSRIGPRSPMFEATEKSWNAVDVSRKAEKEISNKEWNERTAKKLDMLKSLNTAGKFKKDWDEEKLQGWVDQNYSWEKLSKQFKLNESYSEMFNRQGPRKPNLNSMADVDNSDWTPDGGGGSIGYIEWEDGTEMTPLEIQDYFEVNHELYDDIMQGLHEMYKRGTVSLDGKEVDTSSIEMGGLEMMRKYGPDDGGPDAYIERAEFIDGTPLTDEQKDRFQDEYPDLAHEAAMDQLYQQEGSCGYAQKAPGGEDLKTPGNTQGMDANKRTMNMMREVIKKEIKRLHENKRIKKNN